MIEDLIWQCVGDGEFHVHVRKQTLFAGRTDRQAFEIVELGGYGKSLLLDGCIQSTEHDERIYHESIVFPAYAYGLGSRSALCLGGANGGLLKQVLRLPNLERVRLVDVDPELHHISRIHLGHMHGDSLSDPRVSLHFGEPFAIAQEFAADADLAGSFDLIIADLPDATASSYASALFTVEFYRAIARLLSPRGIYATQAGQAHFRDCRFLGRVLRTLSEVFAHAIPYIASVPSYGIPWAFALASDGVDFASSDPELIARGIRRLDDLILQSYDFGSHINMFNLPKHIRIALSSSFEAITLEHREWVSVAHEAAPDGER
jgi:spermidine synthase